MKTTLFIISVFICINCFCQTLEDSLFGISKGQYAGVYIRYDDSLFKWNFDNNKWDYTSRYLKYFLRKGMPLKVIWDETDPVSHDNIIYVHNPGEIGKNDTLVSNQIIGHIQIKRFNAGKGLKISNSKDSLLHTNLKDSLTENHQSGTMSSYRKQQTDSTTSDKFKLVIDNDSVFTNLMEQYEQWCISYSVHYKSDRLGRYRVYTVYFPIRIKDQVKMYSEWITPK